MMTLLAQTYKQYHSMLFGLAYRMLGLAADAEDIVQDVFAQYLEVNKDDILNEKAYLTKMTANRCINLLKSSRRQRETYIGEWLPEPLPDDGLYETTDSAERRESIGYAYLVLLQQLTPLERAIYLLKETFGFEYRDIAEILERTELSCRKTFSRARMRVGQVSEALQPNDGMEEAKERFVAAFLRAADTGNFKPLLAFLLDDVTMVADGGAKKRTAINPIVGIGRVQAFLEGLTAKGSFQSGLERIAMNGELGLALRQNGQITRIICMEWEPCGSRVRRIYMVVNPDKLTRFN